MLSHNSELGVYILLAFGTNMRQAVAESALGKWHAHTLEHAVPESALGKWHAHIEYAVYAGKTVIMTVCNVCKVILNLHFEQAK